MQSIKKIRHDYRPWDENFYKNHRKYAIYFQRFHLKNMDDSFLYIGGADSLEECHVLMKLNEKRVQENDYYYIVDSNQGGFTSFHLLNEEFGRIEIGFLGMRKFVKIDYYTEDRTNPFVSGR